jgi:hypothetical protein
LQYSNNLQERTAELNKVKYELDAKNKELDIYFTTVNPKTYMDKIQTGEHVDEILLRQPEFFENNDTYAESDNHISYENSDEHTINDNDSSSSFSTRLEQQHKHMTILSRNDKGKNSDTNANMEIDKKAENKIGLEQSMHYNPDFQPDEFYA